MLAAETRARHCVHSACIQIENPCALFVSLVISVKKAMAPERCHNVERWARRPCQCVLAAIINRTRCCSV